MRLFILTTPETEEFGRTRLINSPQNQISATLGCEWPGAQRADGPCPGSGAQLKSLAGTREHTCSVCCSPAMSAAPEPLAQLHGGNKTHRYAAGLQGQDLCARSGHWQKSSPSLGLSLGTARCLPGGQWQVTQGSLPRHKCHRKGTHFHTATCPRLLCATAGSGQGSS